MVPLCKEDRPNSNDNFSANLRLLIEKRSTKGLRKSSSLIKSISYDQHEILRWILDLRKIERFDVDLTYGRGRFYRKGIPEPRMKFDRYPTCSGVVPADARHVPLADQSVGSVVFDPPFLATTGKSLPKKGPLKRFATQESNAMAKAFGRFDSERELFDFYWAAMRECFRILRPGGILVFKCQDKVSSGRQYWSHVLIANEAEKIGFYLKDLFVLLAKNRITAAWQLKNQKHARKFHGYFWVMERKR